MPAISGGEEAVANAGRLLAAAEQLGVPVVMTEQNPKGLGPTVPDLARPDGTIPVVAKMEFDATRAPHVVDHLPAGHHIVVARCEAHAFVLHPVLRLLGRSPVRRPVASSPRRASSRSAGTPRSCRAE